MSLLLVVQIIGGVIAGVVALGGVAAMLWAVSKVRGVEASLTLLNEANSGLREVIVDLEKKESRDREGFQRQLHAQEKECATAIAKLEGQIDTLTGGLADRIIAAVNVAHTTRADRIDERLTAVEHQLRKQQGDGK